MLAVVNGWQIGAALFAAVLAAPSAVQHRVYIGEEDTAHKYPYVISFITHDSRRSHTYRFCSGTLIAANWVLTAAHCLVPLNINTTQVQYGNMTVAPEQATTVSKLQEVFLHPEFRMLYSTQGLQNDLALVKVDRVSMNRFGNISAVDYRSLTGLAVEYAGYGTTFLSSAKNQKFLWDSDQTKPRQIGRGVVRTCDGDERYRDPFICIAPKCDNKDQDSRPGDSGCPLFHDGKIIGVLMGGPDGLVLGLYTPISPHIDWIHGIMNSHKQE